MSNFRKKMDFYCDFEAKIEVLLWSVHKRVGLVSTKVYFQLKYFAMNMGGHVILFMEFWDL